MGAVLWCASHKCLAKGSTSAPRRIAKWHGGIIVYVFGDSTANTAGLQVKLCPVLQSPQAFHKA